MSLKALLSLSVLCASLLSTQAFAKNECVIKAGADVEAYMGGDVPVLLKGNRARGTLSMLRADIMNADTLKLTAVVEKLDAYNSALRMTAPLKLSLVKQEVRRGEGSSCASRGYPENDPDFKCDSSDNGHWARTVFYLQDQLGNTWTYWDQTPMVESKSALPSDASLVRSLLSDLKKECARL